LNILALIIVSRGVLEHIDKGLEIFKRIKYNRMFMFDLPYNEVPGNVHHKLTNITEKAFKDWENIEFYYETSILTRNRLHTEF
jgi:hypothetical protein